MRRTLHLCPQYWNLFIPTIRFKKEVTIAYHFGCVKPSTEPAICQQMTPFLTCMKSHEFYGLVPLLLLREIWQLTRYCTETVSLRSLSFSSFRISQPLSSLVYHSNSLSLYFSFLFSYDSVSNTIGHRGQA